MTDTKDKIDYLEVDDPIAGQNYVCLSFLSPESFIQDKHAFKVSKFLQSYCKEQKLKFQEVYEKYLDFTYKHEDKLQSDFDEQNNFQTSIRGLKVRGVFDTKEAAQEKAKKLSLTDSGFHTFVGQVGYWLPWDPNADKIQDEVFQNSQLNQMMEQYQDNNINRDMFYEEQKREKIAAAKEEVLRAKREELKKKQNENDESVTEKYSIDDEVGSDVEPEPEPVNDEPEPEPEPVDENPPKQLNSVDEDIKKSLESDDPWMQKKQQEENK